MTRERISLDDPSKPGWAAPPVARLCGARLRLRGIRAVPRGWGVLLRTRSIHTFGMRKPLGVVALDGDLVVRRSRAVPPRRVVVDLGASWILEIPDGHPLPAVGASLRILPS
ncbi:MAG TPA: hypothetical protein VLD62_11790 [Acidimicrobiia bacterium]|nr:hypothetical protein [Acidimicrobiia bacterium]